MADNIAITAGSGTTYGADEVVDGTLGTVKVGYTKLMDGTLDSSNKGVIDSSGALSANVTKLGSTAVDTNSGTKSAGTQRVVLATDQPQLTNALKVDGSAVTQPVSYATTGSGTATGAIRVELPTNGTGVIASVTALGTITPGTAATSLGKAEDAAHTSGDVGVFSLNVGNEAQSTFAADGDYIPQAVDTKGNALTVGNVAHDGVDAGYPLKIGGYAATALPTAVANADRTNLIADKFGRQVTLLGTIRDLVGTQTTTISSSTSETTIVTATASVFNDLTALVCSNTSGTATRVDFRDTTAGSVLFSLYLPAGDTRGVAFSRPVPQTSVNTNWTATCSASVADVRIYAVFDKNK